MNNSTSTTQDVKNTDVEYIKIGNTTYEVTSFYNGNISLLDLTKIGLKRNADAVLRQMENNE